MAVDTLGHLLALHVTPANEQERAQVKRLCQEIQEVTGESVELTFVDQGYTGDQAKEDAKEHGIELQVVKLPQAKKGFVLLPRRWVIERSFAWLNKYYFQFSGNFCTLCINFYTPEDIHSPFELNIYIYGLLLFSRCFFQHHILFLRLTFSCINICYRQMLM